MDEGQCPINAVARGPGPLRPDQPASPLVHAAHVQVAPAHGTAIPLSAVVQLDLVHDDLVHDDFVHDDFVHDDLVQLARVGSTPASTSACLTMWFGRSP